MLLAVNLKRKLTLASILNLVELLCCFFFFLLCVTSDSTCVCRILRSIQRGLKYSGRAGCPRRALPPRQHFSSAMGMGIPAPSFLKVISSLLCSTQSFLSFSCFFMYISPALKYQGSPREQPPPGMQYMLWIILVLDYRMVFMVTLQASMEWWTMSLNNMQE